MAEQEILNVRLGEGDRSVVLLDQSQLPNRVEYRTVTQLPDMVEGIQSLRVRGAPAIGVAAAYAYCLAALAGEGLDEAKETLAASRPTAVNLFWALERIERKAKECGGAAEPLIAEAQGPSTPRTWPCAGPWGPTGRRWCRSTPASSPTATPGPWPPAATARHWVSSARPMKLVK